ncbi:hypothetical protein IMSAGC019_01626 [Lachnospiraceae bacterium]|nr:hypothetical protein IMSAGC019_01626 [Lachnospiraceae bacterium]
MNKHKHLSFEERFTIRTLLDDSASFKKIGRTLGAGLYLYFQGSPQPYAFPEDRLLGAPFQ